MGITVFSKSLIQKAIQIKPDIQSVIELGSQNDYTVASDKPPFANGLYSSLGINDYFCIDLAGDNDAWKLDLSKKIPDANFDLVTDFGSSEHIVQMKEYQSIPFHEGHINSIYPIGEPENIELGYYNGWLNKFSICKAGGIIISENPMTGHWPEHGYSYLGADFYKELCKIADLELVEDGLEAAMGNTTSGINVWSILKKTGSNFPTFEEFQTLPIFKK